MLDREQLSAFAVFLGNLPRKEKLSTLVRWRMVYLIIQVLAAEGSAIEEVPRKASPGESFFCTLHVFFLLFVRYMMDTVTWTAGQLKSGRERPGSVTSFSKL